MEPTFPTVTFPNHYTIVTGLWAEHHGVVGNTMVDAKLGRFTISDSTQVRTSGWWGGEPLWVTAEKQGRRSASMFWPGSEAEIGGVRPTWYERYDEKVPYDKRVTKVLGWLALPRDSAPTFITTYFSAIDGVSHRAGPDSPETREAIAKVDSAVTALWRGIQASPNAANVSMIVVSDHGMAKTSSSRRIVIDDYLEPGTWRVAELNPVAMITPAAGKADDIFARLSTVPHAQAYRKAQIPDRWHFRDNPRIPEILLVAEPGWVLATRDLLSRRPNYGDGGTHGYDNRAPSMQAIFIGAGPAFAQGKEVPRVRNVDLYELMTSILKLRPAPNDGSLDSIRAVLR
jgi:predicted AlkP superfamily pyrophosphatase or phosphodiesterase